MLEIEEDCQNHTTVRYRTDFHVHRIHVLLSHKIHMLVVL